MLILSAEDVRAVLDLDRLADAVEAAMVELSGGTALMPQRIGVEVADVDGMLAAMPALLASQRALVTKLVTVFPRNTDRPSHQAVICCFDPETGTPTAIMDGTYVTAVRTAAGSAVATRHLARASAHTVAIIGTGVQARAHAQALRRLPQVSTIRVAGRDPAKAAALARELQVEAADSIEQALRRADIVCATTHSDVPVVRREWLQPGTHVNSVGYNVAGTGEVDTATMRDALVAVESRDTALAAPPAGALEIRRAIDAGVVRAADLVEIGAVCAGRAPGRTSDDQLTVYKSVGVAVQDAAAAALVVEEASARGIGSTGAF